MITEIRYGVAPTLTVTDDAGGERTVVPTVRDVRAIQSVLARATDHEFKLREEGAARIAEQTDVATPDIALDDPEALTAELVRITTVFASELTRTAAEIRADREQAAEVAAQAAEIVARVAAAWGGLLGVEDADTLPAWCNLAALRDVEGHVLQSPFPRSVTAS